MQDHTAFSADALRILTRLSRETQKLDGYRPTISDKDSVLALIDRARRDSREAIQTLSQELAQTLKPEELAYLREHGIELGEASPETDATQDTAAETPVRRVYRGQVIYEDATSGKPATQSRQRVYRGQVIQE